MAASAWLSQGLPCSSRPAESGSPGGKECRQRNALTDHLVSEEDARENRGTRT